MKQTFDFTPEEVLKLLVKAVGEANPSLGGKTAEASMEYSSETDWKIRFIVNVS